MNDSWHTYLVLQCGADLKGGIVCGSKKDKAREQVRERKSCCGCGCGCSCVEALKGGIFSSCLSQEETHVDEDNASSEDKA